MTTTDLLKIINALDDRSKLVSSSDTKEIQSIQSEVDSISADLAKDNKRETVQHWLFEIQARLHYLNGQYDEAEIFCNEAIRLFGEEYPDATWLKHAISKEQHRSWSMSLDKSELKNVRAEKGKLEGYLALAVIGLIIFVPLFINANSSSSTKGAMIDTCISNINDANDIISSLNDSLDGISSDASAASGSSYDDQASALDDISSKASDAKQDAPSIDCSQPSEADSSN